MPYIPLTIGKLGAAVIHVTKGRYCLVDIADWPSLSTNKWNCLTHATGDPAYEYARRSIGVKGKNVKVMMHRQITGAGPDQEVDHRNHRGLDNRRCNLVVTTRGGNAQNQRKITTRKTYSKYRGVSQYVKTTGKWIASVKHQGRQYYCGVFNDEAEAAMARDAKAKELHANVVLNFPD